MIIPPKNKKDRRYEKRETAEKEPKAVAEYMAAWVSNSGFTSANWLIPGPTKNPIENATQSNHIIWEFSELLGFLTWYMQ